MPVEDEMLKEAGDAGLEYLKSLENGHDLKQLPKSKWLEFLRCVVARLTEIRPDYDRKMEQEWADENNPMGLPPLK
jgi:hypothetical protein